MNKLFLLLLLLMFPCLLEAQGQKVQRPPNIIFILVDDLGYGDVGILNQNKRKKEGKPYLVTPSLDKMAAQGAVLTQSYSNAPVCAPSRASLLTGRTQGHAEVRNNQFDKALEDNYTMANTLQKAGYTTVAIGKWGLQGLEDSWPSHPLRRGFDDYFGYIRHADGHEHYPKEGKYRGRKEVYDGYTNITEDLDRCYTGDLWTARAKKWIIEQSHAQKKQPFFMYLAYDTPHATLEVPTQAYPKGNGLQGGLQWIDQKRRMINTASGEIDSWYAPEFVEATYRDKDGIEQPWTDVNKRYATIVQRLDAQIGDILQLLEDLAIDDETLVVFSSDNGPSLESYLKERYTPEFFEGYGPFDGIKRDLWEGGERMPVLVQWKGIVKPGQQINLPNMLSDWLPTFLDVAGLPAPLRADGTSIAPTLIGKTKQVIKPIVYAEYFEEGYTPDYPDFEAKRRKRLRREMQLIRIGNYSGVRYDIKNAQDDFEIYDVINDPKQKYDLAATLPGVQRQMKARALQMRRPDSTSIRPYDDAYVPGIDDQPSVKGVQWSSYRGDYPWLPNTNNLKSVDNGKLKIPVVTENIGKGNIVSIKGYINILKNGTYTFYINAPGKAFLRIHDAALIDADYHYVSGTDKSGSIRLEAGLHPFTFTYIKSLNHKDDKPLVFEWRSEYFERKAFTPKDFY